MQNKDRYVCFAYQSKQLVILPLFTVSEWSVTVLLSDSGGGRKVSPCNDLCM